MITVSHPIEDRPRDEKRDRVLLSIGKHSWRLSQDEAMELSRMLADFVSNPPPKPEPVEAEGEVDADS